MVVNQRAATHKAFIKAVEVLMSHPKMQGRASMPFQHIGVLTIVVETSDEDHPISAAQISEKYRESLSTTQIILKNLADLNYVKRVRTTGSHGKGRAFFYYSNLRTVLAAAGLE